MDGHDPNLGQHIRDIQCAGELEGVAVFLAADASNDIIGHVSVVDGGRTMAED